MHHVDEACILDLDEAAVKRVGQGAQPVSDHGGQAGQRELQLFIIFSFHQLPAGRQRIRRQFGGGGLRRIAIREPHFAGRLPLCRALILTAKVRQVVQQQLPQPGEQSFLALAVKPGKILLGFEKRLLDEVGRPALGRKGGVELAVGDSQQVLPAELEGFAHRLTGAGPGRGEEPGEFCREFMHVNPTRPLRTGARNAFRHFSRPGRKDSGSTKLAYSFR